MRTNHFATPITEVLKLRVRLQSKSTSCDPWISCEQVVILSTTQSLPTFAYSSWEGNASALGEVESKPVTEFQPGSVYTTSSNVSENEVVITKHPEL